jgi:esterase/lipase superfamily enzyme
MWEDSTGANGSTRALAHVLADKQIPHELFVWGQEWPHDWPSWRAQAAIYLPALG